MAMRKKDKLYTVNKWNKNLFGGGANMDSSGSGGTVYNMGQGLNYNGQGFNWTNITPVVGWNQYNKQSMSLTPNANINSNALGTTGNTADTGSRDETSLGEAKDITYTDNTPRTQGAFGNNSLLQDVGTGIAQYAKNALNGTATGTAAKSVTALTNPVANIAANNAGTYAGTVAANAALSEGRNALSQQAANFGKDAFGKSFEDTLTENALSSTAKTGTGFSSLFGADKLSSAESAGIGLGASVVGGIGKSLISDGYSTPTGNTIAQVGNLAGGVVGAINPVVGGIVTLAGNVVGGLVNRGWGHQTYGVGEAKNYLNQTSGTKVAGSNDDIESIASQLTPAKRVTYRDGWFTDKGENEAKEWNNKLKAAEEFTDRSVNNAAANNIAQEQQRLLTSYYGSGGKLGKDKGKDMGINVFWREPSLFGLGGVAQTHGGNFSNGVKQINAGGSHETNPNEGVQMSVDSEGTPNMVEEGEAVWNDFVFSNRINVPKAVKRKYGIRGTRDITFADAAKQLQKESEERPNDPISKAGLDAALEGLANEQETLKQETAAKEAQKEFMSLSPQEQQAVMQELAARQQAAQEQAVAQQQQQVSPEQQEMLQQQAMQEQAMQEQAMAQQPQPNISAYGGRVNKYGFGDLLAKYFPGWSYTDLANKVYDANKDTLGDKDTWLKANSDVSKWDEATFLPLLQNAWYANDPLAKNSQARLNFTPTSTWNPLVIANKAADSPYWDAAAGSPKADWYGAINESDFANDPAFLELSEEDRKLTGNKLAKALEKTKAYQNFRNYLKSDEKEALAWLGNLAENGSKYAGNRVKRNADGTYSWAGNYKFSDFDKMLQDISYDADKNTQNGRNTALSIGHLTSSPKIQWQKRAYLQDADGNLTQITAPTDEYELINKDPYQTTIDGVNYQDSYYKLKGTGKGKADGKAAEFQEVEPVHKAEWPRYLGLMGPAVGLGLQMAGVGKPNYADLDAAVSASGVTPIMAKYRPIGDYMKYRPFDRDYYTNKLNAQAGATRRALLNSGSSPSRGAQILAADYNHVGRLGDLARQGEEYNLGQREKVATFNRGTNQFNAEAFNRAALQYASDYNKQKQFNAQMQMQAAQMKDNSRASWYNSLYGNIGQLGAGLSSLGKENAQHNMIADMAAQGLFGVIDPNSPMGMRVVRFKDANKDTKSRGGRINKRKRGGLTY